MAFMFLFISSLFILGLQALDQPVASPLLLTPFREGQDAHRATWQLLSFHDQSLYFVIAAKISIFIHMYLLFQRSYNQDRIHLFSKSSLLSTTFSTS